ncbi:MAG TPA: hypothetical protein VMZ33_03420 [Candidatus Limnocylindrales bacterium]|nr:hypothetical protein [Candidatus Limnocylindrales bacterium]
MNSVRPAFDRLTSRQRLLVLLIGLVAVAILLLLVVQCTQGSPSGSPPPTNSGRQTTAARTDGATGKPTDGSTDQPSGDPTGSPEPTEPTITPPPDLDAPTAELFQHIPNALRSSCQTGPFLAPVVATLYCTTEDGAIAVQYLTYPDADSMNAAHGTSVALAEAEPGTGRCYNPAGDGTFSATLGRWPAEQPYSVGGQEVGRYLCFESNQPTIAWTDERFNILTLASGPADTLDRLVTFWVLRSGPYPLLP